MLEFVIVGGGIHGTYLSNLLVSELGWPAEYIKVIDPYDRACARWKELTARTAMKFLRSPIVHNLGVSPWDLKKFQNINEGKPWATSFGVKERPSLAMFNRHVETLCDKNGLSSLRIKGEATAIVKTKAGLIVKSTAGDFHTRRVILATSSNDKLLVPTWASQIAPLAKHIFQADFSLDSIRPGERQVIVGAGITAAQVALYASSVCPGRVKLVIRRPLKIAEFDSEPCWMGPKCLSLFAKETSYVKRREMIKSARNKGTVTPEVYEALRRAERRGDLQVVVGDVVSARLSRRGTVALLDAHGNQLAQASNVILATGFVPGRPGGQLLDQVISNFNMPVAPDGFPIVQSNLHWRDGIYVTGALAELEIGPPARNILGARLAADRLRKSLHPLAHIFLKTS